ncbi:hypothetical protein [Pantoea sp. At-9b]|uniref:hypothetical protein n=1 Tax=Pantoea sp. (strain At-9b) TaxID=592316 RepID=UPI0005A023F5|nr:hypothetical protein [Pantoea sp. At-9b]
MRLALAFPLRSALRMPPTPPPERPQKKQKIKNKKRKAKRKALKSTGFAAGGGAPSGLAERMKAARMSRMDAAKGGVEQERIDAGPSAA